MLNVRFGSVTEPDYALMSLYQCVPVGLLNKGLTHEMERKERILFQ